jgi:hypothetical protein
MHATIKLGVEGFITSDVMEAFHEFDAEDVNTYQRGIQFWAVHPLVLNGLIKSLKHENKAIALRAGASIRLSLSYEPNALKGLLEVTGHLPVQRWLSQLLHIVGEDVSYWGERTPLLLQEWGTDDPRKMGKLIGALLDENSSRFRQAKYGLYVTRSHDLGGLVGALRSRHDLDRTAAAYAVQKHLDSGSDRYFKSNLWRNKSHLDPAFLEWLTAVVCKREQNDGGILFHPFVPLHKYKSSLRPIWRQSVLAQHFTELHKQIEQSIRSDTGRLREWLESFRAVARCGSLKSASAQLSLARQTVANHLTSLNETLGTILTVTIAGQGRPRTDLTDEGHAVAEWLDLFYFTE